MTSAATISVLLPTRGRASLCAESVASLRATASQPDAVEVVLRRDVDDGEAYGIAGVATCLGAPAGYAGLASYYDDCARAASGSWLLVWNDDCVMRTRGWDEVIAEHAAAGDWIALPHGHFPVLSRRWYEATGRLATSPHVDTYLCYVIERLVQAGAMPRPGVAERWDVWHRCDEIDDEGSARRRAEILGPDGTSARFFGEAVQAEIRRDADRLIEAMRRGAAK